MTRSTGVSNYVGLVVYNWNEGFQMMATDRLDYVVDAYYHAFTARFPRLR